MKIDNTNELLTDQLKTLNIDERFYAYEYLQSYLHTLVTRFSKHFVIPDYLSCFQNFQRLHTPSVQHPMRNQLRTHALAALVLVEANDSNPFLNIIKLLAINAVLNREIGFDHQELHALRAYIINNSHRYHHLNRDVNYRNGFDSLKENLDTIFEKRDVKNFVARLLDVYFAKPFPENDSFPTHKSKREKQIQRNSYTSPTILTDLESNELANVLVGHLEKEHAPIATLLVLSRIFSLPVDDAYQMLIDNFNNIQSKGVIVKTLKNPKSIVNKAYYETSNETVDLILPLQLQSYIQSLDIPFDPPSNTAINGLIDEMKKDNKALQRITLTLIKSSSVQYFNLLYKNTILSYIVFGDKDEMSR